MKRNIGLLVVLGLILTVVFSGSALGDLKEDIIYFNGQHAQVVNAQGRWKIAVGNMWLLDFENNQAEAQQALNVIRRYQLNQQCFVGRPQPSMEYYLSNGRPPMGPMPGEDAIRFDNTRIKVMYMGGRWKIVENGNHAMLDFDQNEDEAWRALRIIWKYDFSYLCFVGRPNPSMTYFRR